MVVTTLTINQSDYAVGVRDTHVHVRLSTPTVGAVKDGYGVFVVERGGSFISSSFRYGVLDYQYLLQNGDKLWAKFVDRDGNEGEWQTHTAIVDQVVNYHVYVDAIAGNDANPGTEVSPVRTGYRAGQLANANVGGNQVGAIHFKRGQTHDFDQTQPIWSYGGSRRRIIFDDYGIGSVPVLRRVNPVAANFTAFLFGNQDSGHFRNLDIDGATPIPNPQSQVCIEVRRNPGTKVALNLIIQNCTIRNFETCVSINDSTMTTTGRGLGHGDFVCYWESTLRDVVSWHIFDSLGCRYVSITDCDILTQTPNQPGLQNTTRISNWFQFVCHKVTWNPGNGGSLRMQSGYNQSGSNDIGEMAQGSFSECEFFGVDRTFNKVGFGRPAPDSTQVGICRDIRFYRLKTYECGVEIGVNPQFGNNNYSGIQFWSCSIGGSFTFMGGPAFGQLQSFEAIDCATVFSGVLDTGAQVGPQQAFNLPGAQPERYATGSIKIRGHVAVWPTNSADFQRRFLHAPRLTQAQLYPIVDSNYNHCSNQSTGIPLWTDVGFNLGAQVTQTLAAWQAATVNDDNSTTRESSVLGIINIGTHGLNQTDLDCRYNSGAGPMNNAGWPRPHSLDGDAKIRSATPDAGPFEFGATAVPGQPTIGVDHPVRIRNLASNRFIGWHRVNTDATVTDLYGITNGTQWVRGGMTGLDTRAVDIFVDLQGGQDLLMNNLVANPATAPGAVTPVQPWSGAPQIGGQSMTEKSSATEGQALVKHYQHRIGAFVVDMWTRWYPNEPWVHAEVMVNHSDQTTTALYATWPDNLLTWGGGILTILGRSAAPGSIIQNGTSFTDGQCRCLPILWTFPAAIRGNDDFNSLQVLGLWGITGHGIKNYHPDGPPYHYDNFGDDATAPTGISSTEWAGVAIAGSISRLHDWEVSNNPGWNIKKGAQDAGGQSDQTFVCAEPMIDVAATLPRYLEMVAWGKKPCHYREPNGDWVTPANHPTLRLWWGRPFNVGATGGVFSPDWLGKTAQLPSGFNDWYGPNLEHWLTNGLYYAVRYTGTPMAQAIYSNWANVYLMQRFVSSLLPPAGEYSYASPFSTRDLVWEPINVVQWWRGLKDRTLATAVRDRYIARCQPSGPQGAIHKFITDPVYPAGATPTGDIWDVRNEASPSIPADHVPGWIPWQQAPACWALDFARRTFAGTMDWMLPYLLAAAKRCLDDVWKFEGGRWVEYERQSLPIANGGTGVYSRSNGPWSYAFLPPVIPFLLANPGSLSSAQLSKANAIWAQILSESVPHDRSWFPPNTLGGGQAPTLVSISVTPNPTSQSLGYTRQFTAIGTYSDSSALNLTESVNWTTSAGGVATVSNTAGSRGLASTVSVGSATLTATEPTTSVAGGATFNVTAAVLVSIAVTPASATIEVEDTQQFTATGTYSNGSTANITGSVIWVSSSRITGLVDQAGLATGVTAGATQITASQNGIVAAATLTVTDPGEPPIIVPTGNPGSLVSRRRAESPGLSRIPLGRILDPERP